MFSNHSECYYNGLLGKTWNYLNRRYDLFLIHYPLESRVPKQPAKFSTQAAST